MRKLLLVLALTSACKKSDDSKKTDEAAKPTTVETTKTDPPKVEPAKPDPAKPEPAKTEPAVAPVNAAKLATGETRQGCFAWSATKKSAACVVGEQGSTGREVELAYVGTAARSPLADSVDDGTAKKENDVLARDGYVAFADKAVEVPQNTKTDAGGSLSLTWTIKQTSKGGDSVAPSHTGKVTATCNGKDTVLHEQKNEEGQTFTVKLRTLGTHALVEVSTSLAREGEYAQGTRAFLIDTASCATTTAE
jgi:hypothetical protein